MDTAAKKPGLFQRALAFASGVGGAVFNHDTALRCAGTAFFGFLSLFPAIGILYFTWGLVADTGTLLHTIDAMQYLLPAVALDLLREQMLIAISQPPVTLSVGLAISIALALWSGSRGVHALVYAMSRVRREPEQRGFIKATLIAFGLTLGGSLFLVLSLLVVAGLPALLPENALLFYRWPFLFVITTLVLMALYRWGPDRHPRRFAHIWPGAVIATTLWLVLSEIFSLYVENFANYHAIFGSVTAIAVLMLWLYNSAQILVLGAAFNAQLDYQ